MNPVPTGVLLIEDDPTDSGRIQTTFAGVDNNAWCQDNETSWSHWNRRKQHSKVFSFTRGMLAFRGADPILSRKQFFTDAEIHWFDPQGESPN